MTPWSAFLDYVLPDVPACTLPAANIAIRQSAIAFCEQSLAYKTSHNPIAVVSGTAEYDFQPPDQTIVHAITYAKFDDTELQARVSEYGMTNPDWRTEEGVPKYIFGGMTALTLIPLPNIDGTLTMLVALKPSPSADGLDDNIFNEFREAIVHGALYRLMSSPKKPYSDPVTAADHRQLFNIMAGQAGSRSDRNFTRAPLRTTILRR